MAKFVNVGHRGAAAYVHENTLASLEEAVRLHADMIEFDIRRTADNVLILFHDSAIIDAAGHKRSISKIPLGELQRLAAAQGFEIATLEQILRQLGDRIPFNIEIKVAGVEPAILELLQKFPPAFSPTLSSFFPWVLWRLKYMRPTCNTALILGQDHLLRVNLLARPVIKRLVSILGVRAVHLQENLVSRTIVEDLAAAGIALLIWTVDDPERMRTFLNYGVDGIITNKPDILYNICLEMTNSQNPILKTIDNSITRFAYAV